MTTATVVGSTGLVGHEILSQLLQHPSISSLSTITRRPPPVPADPKLKVLQSTDNSTWPSLVSSHPSPIFFSALGTTRAAAGSFQNQYAIDHTLNLALATSARSSGTKTYVLISSSNASSSSWLGPYARMKGQLEEDVIKLGFERTVILRPGLILGDRGERKRVGEEQAQGVTRWLETWGVRTEGWSQRGEWIARAAVRAGLGEEGVWEGRKWVDGGVIKEGEEERRGKVWIMDQREIVELGKPREGEKL